MLLRSAGAQYTSVVPNRENSTNLDALRSIAVLLVFLSHLLVTFGIADVMGLPVAEFGRSGVLLFFVHTSLVLMMSMQRMKLSNGWREFVVFYVRRFFRIYPLSIVCIILMLSVQIPAEPDARFHTPTSGAVASNLLLVMNITEHPPVLGPLWSLPYEVQMYMALPFLFLFVQFYHSTRRLLLVMGLWAAAALAERALLGRSFVLQFGPCFVSGVLAYELILRQRRLPALPAFTWPIAVSALTVLYVFTVKATHISSDVPPGWIMCLALGFMIPLWREIESPIVARAAKEIAKYSYGIYLFHNPIIWLSFIALAAWHPLVRWCALMSLMVAVPFAAFHTIESPMIQWGKKIAGLVGVKRPQGVAASQTA